MFELIKPGTNYDFVGKRKLYVGLSMLAIVGTIIGLGTKGLNYGIDFTGGAEVQLAVPQSWDIGKVRESLEAGGMKDLRIQEIAAESEAAKSQPKQFIIKAKGDESTLNKVSAQVSDSLGKQLKAGEFEIERVDVVGPAAGSSLRLSGALSMFYALLCILIYVTVRFDYRYAPGAVLALFHDTMITIGVFIITQKQFDLQILAAVLALIGYSNNDTIIVYDRVRETVHANPGLKIEDAVNRAVNETLGRTVLTSVMTFVTACALYFFGGHVIRDFAFTFIVGIIVGTYSSVFIASSLVIFMAHYDQKRAAKLAAGGKGPAKTKRVNVRPQAQA